MAENGKKEWSGWEDGYDLYGLYASKGIRADLERHRRDANVELCLLVMAIRKLTETASRDPVLAYLTLQTMLRQLRFFPRELANEKRVHDEASAQFDEGLGKIKAMASSDIECAEQILRSCHTVGMSALALDAYWDWHDTWPQSPCKKYLAELHMRLLLSDELKPLPDAARASNNFLEGLHRIQQLLNTHPGINSKHFDFAEQLRDADLAEAEALAKKLTKVKACCPSCKTSLPASLLSLEAEVHCSGCKRTFTLTDSMIDEPDDALVPPPLP